MAQYRAELVLPEDLDVPANNRGLLILSTNSRRYTHVQDGNANRLVACTCWNSLDVGMGALSWSSVLQRAAHLILRTSVLY